MEMLQLRYFYETAMSQSIAKTAQKYMVPSSSVSASIKRLEQELETELFVRTSNRIILNEKGRQLLVTVSNILTQLDVTVNAISEKHTEKQIISVLARCTRETISHWIMRFYRLYPSVFFKLTLDDAPENYKNYDVIISAPEDELADYESFSWRRYGIYVEASDADPLCRGTVTLNQLRDRLFATTNTRGGGFSVFTKACERQGFTPKVFFESNDYTCRNVAVASGICLGLNLRKNAEITQPNMRFLNILDFKEELTINVYYKKEAYNGNIKLFLDLLKTSDARP